MEKKIDICCLQEIDISVGYNHELLAFKGYNLLIEKNKVKSRMGMYVKNGINFVRKTELEGEGNGLLIIDVKLESTWRLIGLYFR